MYSEALEENVGEMLGGEEVLSSYPWKVFAETMESLFNYYNYGIN